LEEAIAAPEAVIDVKVSKERPNKDNGNGEGPPPPTKPPPIAPKKSFWQRLLSLVFAR
ncbi:MAG: hypothetical protein FD167_149, partial [bacterium]